MRKIGQNRPAFGIGDGSVRSPRAWRAGYRIPDCGKIGRHAQVNLAQQVVLKRVVQSFERLARGQYVLQIACFDRAIDGLAAIQIEILGLVASILQRLEKAGIGGIVHFVGLSLRKPVSVYKCAQ